MNFNKFLNKLNESEDDEDAAFEELKNLAANRSIDMISLDDHDCYSDIKKYDSMGSDKAFGSFISKHGQDYVVVLEHPGEDCVVFGWSKSSASIKKKVQELLNKIDDEWLNDEPDFELLGHEDYDDEDF